MSARCDLIPCDSCIETQKRQRPDTIVEALKAADVRRSLIPFQA